MRRARANGCNLVPAIHQLEQATVVRHEEACWDLLEWLPGQPAACDATPQYIRSGAVAIARFHRSVRSLGERFEPAPAVSLRIQRIRELGPPIEHAVNHTRGVTAGSTELDAALDDACRLLRWKWGEIHTRITRSLTRYTDVPVLNHYVLRDVHREHVLFEHNEPSGLIDFDAVRIDTPATDLARWIGGFLDRSPADRELAWQAALAGFGEENPLKKGAQPELDPEMARDLCFATAWISLANWVVWLLCEQRGFPAGPQVVAARIREMLRTVDLNG